MRGASWLFVPFVAIGCSAEGASLDRDNGDRPDVSWGWDTQSVDTSVPDSALADDTSPIDSAATADSDTIESSAPDSAVDDTLVDDTLVAADTSVEPDTFVADTYVAPDTFVADTFVPDTCSCTTPPAKECADGNTVRSYGAIGSCSGAGGSCEYPTTLTSCSSPPATTCVGSALRTYVTPGTCSTGSCNYAPIDTPCPSGCTGSACNPDACAVSLSYDFESSDQGFTHSAFSSYSTDDPWKRGTPSGSITCHGGTKCWSTGLTSNYANCQTAQLSFPAIDLTKCAASSKKVTLSFWHYYDFEALSSGKYWDGGLLQVSTDGTTWTDVVTSQPYDGTIKGDFSSCTPVPLVNGHAGWSATIPGGAWKQVTYDIPAAYRVAALRFRLVFGSDAATTKRGWYVDDVSVTSTP